MNKYIKIAIVLLAIVAVLVIAFFSSGTNVSKTESPIVSETPHIEENMPLKEESVTTDTATSAKEKDAEKAAQNTEYENNTEPAKPVDEKTDDSTDGQLYCTLSVKCNTVLNNLHLLPAEKHGIIPQDGIIYPEQKVVFYDGESVFNVLLREMKKNKIHFEFVNTPIYKSAYIEGIGNLYEFDCGELSGWMYKVNDWFPNYGCSRHLLKDGDTIEFIYSCDFGDDIGGRNIYTEE